MVPEGEGFLLSPWTGMLFFRICRRYGIEGRVQRIELMRLLVARGRARYLRDVKEFIADKNVIRVTKDDKIEESNN